jgi:hypothetical protein
MPATATDRLYGISTSVAVKPPCRVATTANITLAGLQTISGLVLVAGDRVLVKDQTDTTTNGIYIASTSAWSRAPDFDGTRDVVNGTLVVVCQSESVGTINIWQAVATDPVVIGTSAITFMKVTNLTLSAVETQTATAGQTLFALTEIAYTPGTNDLQLFSNGLRLVPEVDYEETSSTSVTLVSGAAAGDEFLFSVALPINVSVLAAAVGYTPSGAGAAASDVQTKLRERKSVLDFDGVVGDGVNDDTAGLALARAFLAANATRYKLVFPSGIYKYSVSPNWGIQDAQIEAEGEVRLRYTGVGNAVTIDAGSSSFDHVYNMRMGHFIVEAPDTALNGVFVRGIHHSNLGFNVRGAGSASAGIYVRFAVCTTFDRPIVSANEEGWYLSAKPAVGISLQIRNAGETVSYCAFNNPIVEGPDIGIELEGTLGNSFFGGTSEGCSNFGVSAGAGSNHDTFFKTDFEVNTTADVYCLGNNLTLEHCESDNYVNFGPTATRCAIIGGEYKRVLFDTGSTGCVGAFFKYDRFDTGATFVDAGTLNSVFGVKSAVHNESYLTGMVVYGGSVGVAADAVVTTTVAVPGAAESDPVAVALYPMTAGFMVSAYVSAADVVTVQFLNKTGGVATLDPGTIKAVALRL